MYCCVTSNVHFRSSYYRLYSHISVTQVTGTGYDILTERVHEWSTLMYKTYFLPLLASTATTFAIAAATSTTFY